MTATAVPLDTGDLTVVIDAPDNGVYIRMAGPWPASHEVATADDLDAAMSDETTFTVTWTPPDASPPVLKVYEGIDESVNVTIERLAVDEGTATYRFIGPALTAGWSVVGSSLLTRTAETCEGLSACQFTSHRFFNLGPDLAAAARH
jgi:hypothetical protein